MPADDGGDAEAAPSSTAAQAPMSTAAIAKKRKATSLPPNPPTSQVKRPPLPSATAPNVTTIGTKNSRPRPRCQQRGASRKNRQEKISDEELLRRYERYVKVGREKSGLGDEKKRKRKAV